MADVKIHGVAVPDWLQKVAAGDPVEVTIKGTLVDVFCDGANGPDHLVMEIRYGDPTFHALGPGLHIVVPAEPGVSIRTFVSASVSA